jgi:hypothetical protein
MNVFLRAFAAAGRNHVFWPVFLKADAALF